MCAANSKSGELAAFNFKVDGKSREKVSAALSRFDGHSDWSRDHCKRVGAAAGTFARYLGASEQAAETMEMAASLHDLGKLTVDPALLNVTSPLSEGPGLQEIRRHAGRGGKKVKALLNGADPAFTALAANMAETHHEKFDGGGYPRGLSGRDIPFGGRLVALCDVFDAMNTARPHQREFTAGEVLCAMVRREGRLEGSFDPTLLKPFIRMKMDEMKKREKESAGPLPEQHRISTEEKKALNAFLDPEDKNGSMPVRKKILKDRSRL